jgi:hypothetical protein
LTFWTTSPLQNLEEVALAANQTIVRSRAEIISDRAVLTGQLLLPNVTLKDLEPTVRLFDAKAAAIPQPDFSFLDSRSRASSSPSKRLPFVSLALSFAALAACLLVFVLLFPERDSSAPKISAPLVDQIFLSTSSAESSNPSQRETPAFSAILKTIDAGFSRWDNQLRSEE